MTDNCNQELERSGHVSSSDDDSVSLLHDMNDCPSRARAKSMEEEESDLQHVNKEQENSLEMVGPKVLEEQMSSFIHSKSANSNVSTCVKITNKTLHKRNAKGETLLHKACRRKDVAQIKALIQAGISVNMEDHAGWTPLHEASAEGDKAVVEELLKAGAHVNIRGFDGFIALHNAASSGHCQVVKLLLQHGSSASDRNVHGLTALDLAERNIKDLLSSGVWEQPGEAPVPARQTGATSSEALCHTQLSCHSGLRLKWTSPSNSKSRESDDRDGAGDVQLMSNTDTLKHSQAVEVVLEKMERNQREMSAWPLTNLQEAGRYYAALTHIQNVLTVVLTSQHLEKHNVAQRYRGTSGLQQRLLKSHLVSLASCQKNLIEILQKQLDLVKVYVTTKNQLSRQSSSPENCIVVKQPSYHSYTQASTKSRDAHGGDQEHSQMRQTSSAPLFTQTKRPPTHTCSLNKKTTSSCHSSTSQPGNTLQHINFQVKGNALIQTQCDDNSRHLFKLIQRGVLPPGSDVELLLKGQWHHALVTKDGSIKDRKGKLHPTPERWLESILGKNIPVSSVYAWDKVLFREKSLSHYLFNMEAEGNTASGNGAQLCMAASSQDTLATDGAGLNCLLRVKIVHLVDDDEMLPNAVLNDHWEKLLKKDCSELEDW